MAAYDALISAQVVLYSSTGSSILEHIATVENVQSLLAASQEQLEYVRAYFSHQGFITTINNNIINIQGAKSLFESVFDATLQLKQVDDIWYASPNTPIKIPQELLQDVAGIVFSEPMEYF